MLLSPITPGLETVLSTPFIPIGFLLVKVCAFVCASSVSASLLWAGQNGLPPRPNTSHLGCSNYHLHRGVDNFLEVGGGLKTVQVKFLHYHTHFCMTSPLIIMFAKKSKGALAPPSPPPPTYLHPCSTPATIFFLLVVRLGSK